MTKVERFQRVESPLPQTYHAWQLFGAGLEQFGEQGAPSRLALRPPKDNEVLLRVDAVGICLSDIKIITLGGEHPRLRGRDLRTEPVVLGHECAVTVVAAGANYAEQFPKGRRYIVQADIYYQGRGLAFGYMLAGGMAEYTYVDERVLEGDEGCYLLPVAPHVGYSQAALAEPWACVEMSYSLEESPLPEGSTLLVGNVDVDLNTPGITEVHRVALEAAEQLQGEYDTIVLESPRPGLVTHLFTCLRGKGKMLLLGEPAEEGASAVDVGAIHYGGKRIYGGAKTIPDLARRYTRHDFLPGGTALLFGAGGPMGQMHVQRAIELPQGPALVVAVDLDAKRLAHLERRYAALAQTRGRTLRTVCGRDFPEPKLLLEHVKTLAPSGYTDIVILAPAPALVPSLLGLASDSAFVNVFAGVPLGSYADIPLRHLCRGIHIVGSSGSRIRDLRCVLDRIERGELNTNLSVAAVGGLNAAADGLRAVKEARFPGKVVLYPHIHFPLTPLEELGTAAPSVASKMAPDGAWTREAEHALLEAYLP